MNNHYIPRLLIKQFAMNEKASYELKTYYMENNCSGRGII